jgi:hypothetical protein
MNSQERINLKKLVEESDCVDNTENIRKVKHSTKILNDIRTMEQLKKKHANLRETDQEAFAELCRNECSFMFMNYPDILNKQIKDELNLGIMVRLIQVLQMIEEGKVDQHEGSVIVGKFLKELYVDSALRRADNLDKQYASEVEEVVSEPKTISWKEYKKMN